MADLHYVAQRVFLQVGIYINRLPRLHDEAINMKQNTRARHVL